jgi:nucleotide-binding universal stress UspA family protein
MPDIAWKKVCCPVDYSEASQAALRVAVDLCRRLGAELTLLHVDHVDDADAGDEGDVDAWRRDAVAAGVPTRAAETRGDPKTAIADWTDEHGMDAIVMGTHGRTGRAHALVGSVAENTLRRARCPVMVVHAEWPTRH